MKSPAKPMRFTSSLERSANKLWGAHLAVPKHAVNALTDAKSRRVVCSLNGTSEHQCALVPFGNGTFVITVNKSRRESLRLSFGSKVDVTLRKDRTKYGLPMPEELKEVFRQDNEGDRLFHALTPGRQRTLIYMVNSGKGLDERVFRAVTIVRHLKENNGVINYKKLTMMLRKSARHKTI